jgi:error-prone DNA polymerase
MTFRRRWLTSVGVVAIARLVDVSEGQRVIVAGKVISAQRPPTAKGMGFLVLEDETGRVQVACPPGVADTLRLVLVESRFVAVLGRVERLRWHRSLLGRLIRPLPRAMGSLGRAHTVSAEPTGQGQALTTKPA